MRKEVVAELRRHGQDDDADLIAKLKKPTVSAWVANQLSKTRELDMQRLLKAGEVLEQAQRDLLSGKSPDFESARREETAAIRLLQSGVKEILPGASPAILDRINQTLRSATSAENRALLKKGRLTEDVEPPGIEAFAGGADVTPIRGAKLSSSRDDKDRTKSLNEQKREANKVSIELGTAAVELERVAREAEVTAKKARQKADAARAQADKAATAVRRLTDEIADLSQKK